MSILFAKLYITLKQNKTNEVRINAGEWRSRVLKFPDVPGLRPTPDRVRQTLFNWLGQDLTGFTCLDLFAGTGVMGFEALSRGAKSVTLVEKSPQAYLALQDNQRLLKADRATILQQDALQYLQSCSQRFNLIFLDPPYEQQWLPKILPLAANCLEKDGWLYAEAEYALASDDTWTVVKNGKAGNVFYHLLKSAHE